VRNSVRNFAVKFQAVVQEMANNFWGLLFAQHRSFNVRSVTVCRPIFQTQHTLFANVSSTFLVIQHF